MQWRNGTTSVLASCQAVQQLLTHSQACWMGAPDPPDQPLCWPVLSHASAPFRISFRHLALFLVQVLLRSSPAWCFT